MRSIRSGPFNKDNYDDFVTVTDILCENGRAVGVAIQKGGENIVLKAKLIISAAGLYNTLNLLPESIRIQSSE